MRVSALLGFAFFLFQTGSDVWAASPYSKNDVSILIPKVSSWEELETLHITTRTSLKNGQPLLPLKLLQSMDLALPDPADGDPTADRTDPRHEHIYKKLAAVGIRLDPCFQDHFEESCRPQIRMVFQPFLGSGEPFPHDGGIHLFFDVPRESLLRTIRFMKRYRKMHEPKSSVHAPLQIHPVLAKEGLKGEFWRQFKIEVTRTIDEGTLSRVAVFSEAGSDRWSFVSFDIIASKPVPLKIGSLGEQTSQRFGSFSPASDPHGFKAPDDLPAVNHPDQLFRFLNDSLKFKNEASPEEIKGLKKAIDRLSDPKVHLPGTIDCLSCHAAPTVQKYISQDKTFLAAIDGSRSDVTTKPALSWLYQANHFHTDFRMFGYSRFEDKPIIAPRVIHETALIVEALNEGRVQ